MNPAEPPRPQLKALTPAQVAPLAVVVIGMVAGLVVVALGRWELGCVLAGIFVAIGGIGRMVLPTEKAGLLRVRSRFFDTIILLGMAAMIIVLAVSVPS